MSECAERKAKRRKRGPGGYSISVYPATRKIPPQLLFPSTIPHPAHLSSERLRSALMASGRQAVSQPVTRPAHLSLLSELLHSHHILFLLLLLLLPLALPVTYSLPLAPLFVLRLLHSSTFSVSVSRPNGDQFGAYSVPSRIGRTTISSSSGISVWKNGLHILASGGRVQKQRRSMRVRGRALG